MILVIVITAGITAGSLAGLLAAGVVGYRYGWRAGERSAVTRALKWKNPEAWELAHGILHEVHETQQAPTTKIIKKA